MKSTTLYLDDKRLSVRLPFELWRQLANYSLDTKEKGNTLLTRLLSQHFGITDLTKIHNQLLRAKTDPVSGASANTVIVNLLTEFFND